MFSLGPVLAAAVRCGRRIAPIRPRRIVRSPRKFVAPPRRTLPTALAPKPRIVRRVANLALGCTATVLPTSALVPSAVTAMPSAAPPAMVAPADLPFGIGAGPLLPMDLTGTGMFFAGGTGAPGTPPVTQVPLQPGPGPDPGWPGTDKPPTDPGGPGEEPPPSEPPSQSVPEPPAAALLAASLAALALVRRFLPAPRGLRRR